MLDSRRVKRSLAHHITVSKILLMLGVFVTSGCAPLYYPGPSQLPTVTRAGEIEVAAYIGAGCQAGFSAAWAPTDRIALAIDARGNPVRSRDSLFNRQEGIDAGVGYVSHLTHDLSCSLYGLVGFDDHDMADSLLHGSSFSFGLPTYSYHSYVTSRSSYSRFALQIQFVYKIPSDNFRVNAAIAAKYGYLHFSHFDLQDLDRSGEFTWDDTLRSYHGPLSAYETHLCVQVDFGPRSEPLSWSLSADLGDVRAAIPIQTVLCCSAGLKLAL